MIEIRETEIYSRWFKSLRNRQAKARIDIRIRRYLRVIQATLSQWDKVYQNFALTMVRAIECILYNEVKP